MIWYDVDTKMPVAPGACEDAGAPSIEGYDCIKCNHYVKPDYQITQVEGDGQLQPLYRFGIGVCPHCGYVMLTTLL